MSERTFAGKVRLWKCKKKVKKIILYLRDGLITESDTMIFGIVYPNSNIAIKNSKEILNEQHNNSVDLRKCNPSTHVHKIVEYLMNMAKS